MRPVRMISRREPAHNGRRFYNRTAVCQAFLGWRCFQAIPDAESGIFGVTPRLLVFPRQNVAWWAVGCRLHIAMPDGSGWKHRHARLPVGLDTDGYQRLGGP
jgi:hypothetical protein